MLTVFAVLARLRFLRGSLVDPFRLSEDRRLEEKMLSDYERMIEAILPRLTARTHAVAVELASLPEAVRGYGHVRQRHATQAERRRAELQARFDAGVPPTQTDPDPAVDSARVVMAG